MLVSLIGLGGGLATVTREALAALEQADAILGSPRLLDSLHIPENRGRKPSEYGNRKSPGGTTDSTIPRIGEVRPAVLAEALSNHTWTRPCVVYSGDTGFHSGAAGLIPLLEERGIPFRVLTGLSSVQLLAARLGRPWQGWNLVSAHGVDCDPVPEVCDGKPSFFLTGPGGVTALCARLTAAGLGNLPVTIGENLSLPSERIVRTTAGAAAGKTFALLSVLLAEAAPVSMAVPPAEDGPPAEPAPAVVPTPVPVRVPGLPDSLFLRGEVPMTKQFVRSAALSLLEVRPDDTLWDIGAGTGSVSVELALAARRGRVYAVERREAARALILRNRERFHVWNLSLAGREAPEDLTGLPVPDAVFLGGTGGRLPDILDAVLAKNPAVRLCISAVTVENLTAATEYLTAHGLESEVVQLSVSRAGTPGTPGVGHSLHLLRAENPVFLIAARGNGAASAPLSVPPSVSEGEGRPC